MRVIALLLAVTLLPALPAAAQLTSTGSQLWHQGSTGIASDPEAHDLFGDAVAAGDFDGDGRADLAIGVPLEDIQGAEDAGVVHVLYGTGDGLSASLGQYWAQGSGLVPGAPEADDNFGGSLAVGDFNGDGRDDLAIGAPAESIGSITWAGAVFILYGSPEGLTDAGSQIWYQGYNGLLGPAEEHELFGVALAAGDFDGDGRDDLAIGTPWEGLLAGAGVGGVQVLYGSSPAGLTADRDQFWHQGTPGVPGDQQVNGHFGFALTAGDFDGDGRHDLAIGSPWTNVAGWTAAGAFTVLYGSASGLATDGAWQFHRDTQGIGGSPYLYAVFGRSLAAGDFNADGRDDLAVGALNDTSGAGGSVNVLYGSPNGLNTAGCQLWRQGVGLPGVEEDYDKFGWALATGDFDDDGRTDLAVGLPGKAIGSADNAGKVQVIYGGSLGLSGAGDQLWSQDSVSPDPVPGAAEAGDLFGHSLTAGDFDGDGSADLAIGVRTEAVGTIVSAGAVNVLYGSDGLRYQR